MIEERNGRYRVIARWRGYPYISVTIGGKKTDAVAYHDTLKALRDDGRRDILALVASGEADLQAVHQQVRDRGARHVMPKHLGIGLVEAPTLGVLYDEWMEWLRRPGTTSPRTGRSFSPDTISRYADSWEGLFEFLGSRSVKLGTMSRSSLDEFADARIQGGASPSTINRDFTAFESFWHWLADHRPDIEFKRPKLKKRQEPKYDEQDRHLEPREIAAVRKNCPKEWWPLFELLYLTGLRISEMQYLLRGDVDLRRGEVHVVGREINRLKSRTSERKVPLAPRADRILRGFTAKTASATDFVFPEWMRDYDDAYRCFEAACIAAGLHDHGAAHLDRIAAVENRIKTAFAANASPDTADVRELDKLKKQPMHVKATRSLHSLRHTYGVACARAGLHPTVIRDLLGHSTITTTERYMRYATNGDEARQHAQAVERALSAGGRTPRRVTPKKPQDGVRRSPASRRRNSQ